MDDELPQDNQENTQQEVQYTEIEQRAMSMGWRPKTEFNGDEADFVDAKEFVNRKPLFDRIEVQSKQLKQVTRALEALKTHYTKVQETEFNRALSALKAERKEALREGDGDKFEQLDDQIKDVEQQIQTVRQVQQTPAVQNEETAQEYNAWVARNRWYESSIAMKAYADEIGRQVASRGADPAEVLREVEKAVRKEFPHKFTNPNKEAASDLGSSRSSKAATSSDSFQLTDTERQIMNTLIRSDPKLFNKEKYIAELKAARGLK